MLHVVLQWYSYHAVHSTHHIHTHSLKSYLASQERLLFVCFYILLNLSEDTAIEYKMKQRHIVRHLIRMLARTNRMNRSFLDELLLLIVTFLKKLSIFEENKSEMVSDGTCDDAQLVTCVANVQHIHAMVMACMIRYIVSHT